MWLDSYAPILFITAVIANTLSAMAGGGTGLLQFPVLIFLGLPFGIALATHKIATVALGIGSTLRYGKEKLLEWKFAAITLGFGLPGVFLGARVILKVNENLAIGLLGLLTLGLGIYSFFKTELGQHHEAKHRDVTGMLSGGLVIFAIGILNGSLTTGTGLFATLWFIHWFGMDYKRAVAHTLVLVGFFWNGTGALTLSLLSTVQWSWLLPLLVGSLIGGYLGANLAISKGNQLIKRVFEAITVITGLSLLFKAFLYTFTL